MTKITATLLFSLFLFPAAARADVMVHDPVSYETATGMTVGAAFMGLHSDTDDTLVSVTSPACDHVEIHSMEDNNGVMKMRKVEGGLDLPADKTVNLEAGGYHLMLIGLKEPLKADSKIDLTLKFKKGKDVTISVPVQSRGALKKALEAPAEHAH